MNQESGCHQTLNLPVLILDFSASRTMGNKYLLFKPPVCEISVRAAWMDENIHIADRVLNTEQDIKSVRGWDSGLPPRSLS